MIAALAGLLCVAARGGTLTVEVFDVGQGDSLLLSSPAGKHVLVDAGPERTEVRDDLRRLGVGRLDLAVATHAHADHIGGMLAVIRGEDVARYLDSGFPHTTRTYTSLMQAIEADGLPYARASAGQVFRMDDGITLRVLWPGQHYLTGTRSDINTNSVVIRLDHGEDCFLFMGDAELPAERALLERHEVDDCEVLKVAHHGSAHSTSPAFLARVHPAIALISVGADNRYGHPSALTLDRLHRAGATVYRTDLTGAIVLESTGHGIAVTDGLPDTAPPGPAATTAEAP